MSRHTFQSMLWVFSLISVSIASALAAQSPIRLHPENPHYFQYESNPTVLITAGEHYGSVLNQRFDYVAYLDELKKYGLNLTRAFSGTYREDGVNPHGSSPLSPAIVSNVRAISRAASTCPAATS